MIDVILTRTVYLNRSWVTELKLAHIHRDDLWLYDPASIHRDHRATCWTVAEANAADLFSITNV